MHRNHVPATWLKPPVLLTFDKVLVCDADFGCSNGSCNVSPANASSVIFTLQHTKLSAVEMDPRFEPITRDDKPQIRQFLLDNYFPDDQILLANGRTTPTEGEIRYILDIIDEELSFKAYNGVELCGIVLNGIFDRNSIEDYQKKVDACRCEIFKKILEFYLSWERDTHRWEILPCDEAFNIHVIAVKSSYRRKGIMKALVNRSLECAKQLEHTSVTVDCSSFYTAKYFQKTGWNCIFALPFVHFKDKQGNPLFVKKNSPHLHATTFHLQI